MMIVLEVEGESGQYDSQADDKLVSEWLNGIDIHNFACNCFWSWLGNKSNTIDIFRINYYPPF